MNELFSRRKKLDDECKRLFLTVSLESLGPDEIPYDKEVTPLLKQIREIDKMIDARRKTLAHILTCMLQEVEVLISDGKMEQARELITPVRQLASIQYEEHEFPWTSIIQSLRTYQERYKIGSRSRKDDFAGQIQILASEPAAWRKTV